MWWTNDFDSLLLFKEDPKETSLGSASVRNQPSEGVQVASAPQRARPAGLEDRPPRARVCPHKTTDAVVDAVVALRTKFPWDGPKK